MTIDTYDATLSDWIVCELPRDRRFLAGQVVRDRKLRFREGAYIATSLVVSPVHAIADGNVVETLNSRQVVTAVSTLLNAVDLSPTQPNPE